MSQRAQSTRTGAPARNTASRRDQAASLFGMAGRVAARRPGVVLASVAVIGGLGVFGWNATMKQSARHPAPLFSGPTTTAAINVEPPRRPDFAALPPASRPETTSATARAPEAPTRPDPIGNLIKTGDSPARPAAAAADAKPAVQPRVVAAQKALAKLGYGPITADGRLGTTTRQAIEKFERDRKLPVTGAVGPKTAKQLASLSGISVE